MDDESFKPAQFILELRAGRWIAIGQIQAVDQDAIHHSFDIAAMGVIRIAGETTPYFLRLAAAREDGNPIPTLLTMPNRAVTRILNGF
jgi:hypothetical protein